MKQKPVKLVLDAWPKLIEALNEHGLLGSTPEEIARFLIIEGLENRRLGRQAYLNSRAAAIASGWRGNL